MINSGIYKIVCLKEPKIYIGSAYDFDDRKSTHWSLLRNKKHHSYKLQRAWNKFGDDNFVFIIIYRTAALNVLELIEQDYIDSYNINTELYNVRPLVSSRFGLKHSEKTKEKLRKSFTEERKQQIRERNRTRLLSQEEIDARRQRMVQYNKNRVDSEETKHRRRIAKLGYKHSEEAKLKISNAHKGKVLSQETRNKLSEACKNSEKVLENCIKNGKGKVKEVYRIDLNTNEIIDMFNSISAAALILNLDRSSIVKCCKNQQKTSGGFGWQYVANYKKESEII